MSELNERELLHASSIVDDLVAGLLDPEADAETADAMRSVLTSAVASGYAAGMAAREPVTPRLTMLAGALRSQHRREMFGDCTEDGDAYPCRTIRALNITVGPAEDEPVITVDDVLGGAST